MRRRQLRGNSSRKKALQFVDTATAGIRTRISHGGGGRAIPPSANDADGIYILPEGYRQRRSNKVSPQKMQERVLDAVGRLPEGDTYLAALASENLRATLLDNGMSPDRAGFFIARLKAALAAAHKEVYANEQTVVERATRVLDVATRGGLSPVQDKGTVSWRGVRSGEMTPEQERQAVEQGYKPESVARLSDILRRALLAPLPEGLWKSKGVVNQAKYNARGYKLKAEKRLKALDADLKWDAPYGRDLGLPNELETIAGYRRRAMVRLGKDALEAVVARAKGGTIAEISKKLKVGQVKANSLVKQGIANWETITGLRGLENDLVAAAVGCG